MRLYPAASGKRRPPPLGAACHYDNGDFLRCGPRQPLRHRQISPADSPAAGPPPAIDGFGFLPHYRRQGEITPGRVRNVPKSVKRRLTWGKCAQN